MKNFLGRLHLWLSAYFFTGLLSIMSSIVRRLRMSHNNGLVGSGELTIVGNQQFPEHAFFEPGKKFSCRIRHACVTYPDDAALQVFGGSLKFADSRWESPLDIEMNTGTISLFWSGKNFFEFARMKREKGWITYQDRYAESEETLRAAQDGVRLVPPSFAELRYHSQTPTLFLARDGVRRYVKYRLLPDPLVPEPGIPSQERLDRVYDAQPPADEQRSRNYLKDEYATRVAQGPVHYRLQLQLHTAAPTDEKNQIFNSNKAWDEATHPWMDLAMVKIHTVHGWDEAVLTALSLGHAPPSLAIIPARDMEDHNSLNYMRVRTHFAKRVRLWMDRVFGVPPRPSDRRIPGNNPWY